jgi:heme/copper-type cytochrome/quinol oxidase subunit 4
LYSTNESNSVVYFVSSYGILVSFIHSFIHLRSFFFQKTYRENKTIHFAFVVVIIIIIVIVVFISLTN